MYISVHSLIKVFALLTVEDVTVTDITINSATISWRIPSFEVPEEYYILYGRDLENLDQESSVIFSPSDTSIVNATYTLELTGLESGTIYYAKVVAAFDIVFERFSEATVFLTKAPGKFSLNSSSSKGDLNCCVFAEQIAYLPFLPRASTSTRLEDCDDCTSEEITFPGMFPFGGYFHRSAYVSIICTTKYNILLPIIILR